MPQASGEDHERLIRLVGEEEYAKGSDSAAIRFLTRKGWALTKHWEWKPPFNNYEISDDEFFAIDFMVWEWDFGGITYGPYYEGKRRFVRNGVPCALPEWTWRLSKEAQGMMHRGTNYDDPWLKRRAKFDPRGR